MPKSLSLFALLCLASVNALVAGQFVVLSVWYHGWERERDEVVEVRSDALFIGSVSIFNDDYSIRTFLNDNRGQYSINDFSFNNCPNYVTNTCTGAVDHIGPGMNGHDPSANQVIVCKDGCAAFGNIARGICGNTFGDVWFLGKGAVATSKIGQGAWNIDSALGLMTPTNCYFPEPECCSPIVLDLDRNELHFVGLEDAVLFDIDADGKLEKISWTDGDTDDAFLWRDLNGNGGVDSGAELFGDATSLATGARAEHGFQVLAELDQLLFGGNGDGVIDSQDPVYSELKVWIDRDHDGISDEQEMMSLAAAGVTEIDLDFKVKNRQDGFGNKFRYTSYARVDVNGRSQRISCADVFFVMDR